MPTKDQTAQTLIDLQDVQRVKSLYCDLIDRVMRERRPEDAEQLSLLFTEDALLDFGTLPFGRHQGRAAITQLFTETLPQAVCWMWHSVSTPIIDIQGDHATGKWTLYALAVPAATPEAPAFPTFGRYADEFRRIDGQWKQSLMRFHNETR
ncbi:nuclear transport factor 2 family protein [Solimonas soli]|jgi:hypothetical protein|uniref:nuclear transport factor 2 family protein n=1 Tax=Solimonas soli TaxID=413479 RepID=UPI00047F6CCD|nr:nuclear transport factor 2 family protein [Solimonas soli]